MRPVNLGTPPINADTETKLDWVIQSLQEIERASQQQNEAFFDEFTADNVTESRSFDADTATVAQLSDVVGTLIDDIKNREI